MPDNKSLTERYNKIKRKLFEKAYGHLNPRQREAVFTVNGPLLVLAGAGSGKTTVLVNRIEYMLRYGNTCLDGKVPACVTEEKLSELEKAESLPPDDIKRMLDGIRTSAIKPYNVLSITFTNKAAGEMKERLVKALGEEGAEGLWAGTFHSVCLRILRRFTEQTGYSAGFTVYDTDDQKKLMLSVIRDDGSDDKMYTPRAVLDYVSACKDALISPTDAAKEAADSREKKMAELYKDYQNRLKTSNAMDFDDIIVNTVTLIRENEEIRSYLQDKFRYVCVDEYQDTNHAQFVLVTLLSGKYRNLMVVGDDDQSIYGFRGADIKNILSFDSVMEGAKVVKLEQNYRSTSSILDCANAIIRNNTGRHDKKLWTENGKGEKICLKQLSTQSEEADYIVAKIMELREKENRKLSDFAVLYRINALSNTLESAFTKGGIPYRVVGGQRFYERKEIKDVLAYLCVVNNPQDNVRLMRIINEPKRKIGEATVEAVRTLADHYGRSMFEIMENAGEYTAISKSAPKLKEFTRMIIGLREIAVSDNVDVLIDKVLDFSGYRRMVEDLDREDGRNRVENIGELISNAMLFMQKNEEATLSDFLEEVTLVADIDNYDPDAEAVVLMTVHSAKGLEFPVVFLPAMEDDIFPSGKSVYSSEEMEEERRLAYVAVTRAKEKLFITHVRERLLYGKTSFYRVSQFVKEIPDELLSESKTANAPGIGHMPGFGAVRQTAKPKKEISGEFGIGASLAHKSSNGGQRGSAVERFSAGDRVAHGVFGSGTVLTVTPAGSDAVYEIAFDNAGMKKMMANYAKLKRL